VLNLEASLNLLPRFSSARARRPSYLVMIATVALFSTSAARAHAGDDAFRITLAAKSPGVFGAPAQSPHSVFGDARQSSSVSGAMHAVLAVKDPQHFGPHSAAADIPASLSHALCRPGSSEAIMSAKLASHSARPSYDNSCS